MHAVCSALLGALLGLGEPRSVQDGSRTRPVSSNERDLFLEHLRYFHVPHQSHVELLWLELGPRHHGDLPELDAVDSALVLTRQPRAELTFDELASAAELLAARASGEEDLIRITRKSMHVISTPTVKVQRLEAPPLSAASGVVHAPRFTVQYDTNNDQLNVLPPGDSLALYDYALLFQPLPVSALDLEFLKQWRWNVFVAPDDTGTRAYELTTDEAATYHLIHVDEATGLPSQALFYQRLGQAILGLFEYQQLDEPELPFWLARTIRVWYEGGSAIRVELCSISNVGPVTDATPMTIDVAPPVLLVDYRGPSKTFATDQDLTVWPDGVLDYVNLLAARPPRPGSRAWLANERIPEGAEGAATRTLAPSQFIGIGLLAVGLVVLLIRARMR